MFILYIIFGLIVLGAIGAGNSLRIVKQYERGVVFRLGRVTSEAKQPGLTAIVPFVDKLEKVNLQIITMPIPAQEGITRDNVTVRVDAVIYFKVVDPRRAIVDVEDYQLAVGQVAQTSLRSIIGQSELDDLLTNRERLNQGLAIMIDNPAVDWGVHIDRVEIKDVALPESMKRSMSRQAEAERERRSRVIIADGELQASNKLAQAAEAMADTPSALQLRLLQTIVEVAAERNSTLVLPFPVELLRFLEGNTPAADGTVKASSSAGGASGSGAGGSGAGGSAAGGSAAAAAGESDAAQTSADLDEMMRTLAASVKLTEPETVPAGTEPPETVPAETGPAGDGEQTTVPSEDGTDEGGRA
ncbi:MAG: slipin family protein [Brevibacterium sp.]|nr:slipin family protein [Brevibacterium sp.]